MLTIEMLPAGHGDCLWIEYGDRSAPRRLLIDAGPGGTYQRALRGKLAALPPAERSFELFMVTHVDADHIADALTLLADQEIAFKAKDTWFNGYRHLPDESPDTLGPVQGEKLTNLLAKAGATWNGAFGNAAVLIPPTGALPTITLAGGIVLTLLSPTPQKLAELKPVWEREVRKAGLEPGAEPVADFALLGEEPETAEIDVDALAAQPFAEDSAPANGSSIAVLVEHAGHRVLLGGDAHPSVLVAAINRLTGGGKLALDACKLPHHGSKANVSPALLRALDCKRYLFSTNGSHFKHPDRQAVARVIKHAGPDVELLFNYRTKFTDVWDDPARQARHRYATVFPAPGSHSLTVELT